MAVDRSPSPEPWFDLIAREVDAQAEAGRTLADRLETIFLGGGTPSLLGPGAIRGIREALGPGRIDPEHTEWTAEANPESFTPELARRWRTDGLNRVSLGVQSFQPDVLRWMGRLHGAEGAHRAVQVAREAGFEQLSIDLIFALPPALERDWRADLEAALSLDPPHISLYGLTAEPETPLGRRVAEGRIVMPEEERYAEAYLLAHEFLVGAGYEHYEVSNFARPGAHSRHNRVYWDGGDYLGVGNSAHSLVRGERFWNHRELERWRAALAGGELPIEASERVTGEAAAVEEAWLSLRTDRGIPEGRLDPVRAGPVRERWIGEGWAVDLPGLRLTPEGWLRLDDLAVVAADLLQAR